jgi:hypothetical protein
VICKELIVDTDTPHKSAISNRFRKPRHPNLALSHVFYISRDHSLLLPSNTRHAENQPINPPPFRLPPPHPPAHRDPRRRNGAWHGYGWRHSRATPADGAPAQERATIVNMTHAHRQRVAPAGSGAGGACSRLAVGCVWLYTAATLVGHAGDCDCSFFAAAFGLV